VRIHRSLTLGVVLAFAPLCGVARAQQPAAQGAASAEALFLEGKKLLEQGHLDEACPKLAESQRLDPGTGTLMTLALCNERAGRTASAWAQFSEALAASKQAGRKDRVAEAQKHVEALAPKLSRLRVVVPTGVADVPGLEVQRDGVTLGRASWGDGAPVDPGDHTVVARAPGKQEWSTLIRVAPNADEKSVTVGPLEDEKKTPMPPAVPPAATPATPATQVESDPGQGQRIVGWIVSGVGLVAVGVGAGFGGYAIALGNDVNARCPSSPCADADAVAKNSDAHAMANVSNVAIIGGAIAMATGVVLVLTAPKHRTTVALVPSPQGVQLHVRF
jgi:hypothetical protein